MVIVNETEFESICSPVLKSWNEPSRTIDVLSASSRRNKSEERNIKQISGEFYACEEQHTGITNILRGGAASEFQRGCQ